MNEERLVLRLRGLTQKRVLRWTSFLDNSFSSQRNGWKFFTEWLQDDKPLLIVEKRGMGKIRIQGYHYGIDKLIDAIRSQFGQGRPPKVARRKISESSGKNRKLFTKMMNKFELDFSPKPL